MPNESVNLYLSIQSGSSERTLTSLTDKTRALDKETQLLQQATEGLAKANKPLIEQQSKLQSELKSSQKVVNDLQKAYDEYGDEMMKLDLDDAIANHAKLKEELTEVNAQIGANQKTYKEYLETVRKGSLSDTGGKLGGGDGTSDLSAIWGGLGVGEQLSSLAAQISGAFLTSTLGDDMGSMVSGALGSTINGAALGMGTADMDAVAQALGRMKSSDKATLEYLNMLNDRGIGAVGMLAEARGVSQGDMYAMISKGDISGSEAVEIITQALKEVYSKNEEESRLGAMEEQSQTFSGLSSTLEGLQQNLEALGGEGYNALRKEGVDEEINSLKGDLGDAIGEINAIMGENQARRENLQDQYMREVLDAVLNGNQGSLWSEFDQKQQKTLTAMSEQYASLMERYQNGDTDAGAELESLYEQAQILGQAYFDNSEEMARLNDIEEAEVQAINDSLAGLSEATQASYRLSQELSKGIPVDVKVTLAGGSNTLTQQQMIYDHYVGSKHAFGLDRVPYDDYPALLHEGERVLTASQAWAQDAGQGGGAPIQLTVTGNNFTGTPEEMADQLWEIIIRKLEQANTAAAPK